MFYILLLERVVTRREVLYQKIANQLEFEEGEQPEQKVDFIMDSMVFGEVVVDSLSPGLYYPIYTKGETHTEDTCELIEKIAHLQQLFKKYLFENLDKPIATSPPEDKAVSTPLMVAQSGAKLAPPIIF